ncbi:MAG: oligopeptide/dipeptide ABC transporter ATP-binding protein [Promethearchaeota archaeon]
MKVKNLKTYFPIKAGILRRTVGWVRAVDDISFDIKKGETMGLVGESGCGKTTVGRVILMLEKPTSGEILFNKKDLTSMRGGKLREQRQAMMMVFQDPFSSLNPRMTVDKIVGEPILINRPFRYNVLGFLRRWRILLGPFGWFLLLLTGIFSGLLSEIFSSLGGPFSIIDNFFFDPLFKWSNHLTLWWIDECGCWAIDWWLGDWWLAILWLGGWLIVWWIVGLFIGIFAGSILTKIQDDEKSEEFPFNSSKTSEKLTENWWLNLIAPNPEITNRVIELLKKVGLKEEHLNRYPHEFSGGQRQRICVARALALNPSLVILDEPTSALDVSVQSQVLNLFKELQADLGLSYLFISHDLAVIEYMSDRVCVMYVGKIVEQGRTEIIYENPSHPYTKALMSAILEPNPEVEKDPIILEGDVPSPANPPPGCRFHPRCWLMMPKCSKEEPPYIDLGDGHLAACWAIEKDNFRQNK